MPQPDHGFAGTALAVALVLSLAGACSKSDEGPKQVKVNGVSAVDCVDLYRNWDKPIKPEGNCAMTYFDPDCTKTTYGVAGAETTSGAGEGGCEQRQLIVARDYKAAREQFGYPEAAMEMSKKQRKKEGYLPPDIKRKRDGLPPGVPPE